MNLIIKEKEMLPSGLAIEMHADPIALKRQFSYNALPNFFTMTHLKQKSCQLRIASFSGS
jgi:hypothetical protein